MENKPTCGVSPLIAFCKAIENIKIGLYAKYILKRPVKPVNYDEWKNNPEVNAAVSEIVKHLNKQPIN